MQTNLKAFLEKLFPSNTRQRLALYNYLSEYFSISDTFFIKHRYYWNYCLLSNNQHLSVKLKAILDTFFNESDYRRESILHEINQSGKTIIDVIKEVLKSIVNNDIKSIDSILSPLKEPLNRDRLSNHWGWLYSDLIKNIYEGGFYNFSNEDLIYCCNVDSSLQGILPISHDDIKNNNINLDWDHISENQNIIWSNEFIKKYKDKLNWCTLSGNQARKFSTKEIQQFKNFIDWQSFSRTYKFSVNQIKLFQDDIDWRMLSYNENIDWTIDLIESCGSKLNLSFIRENLKDTPDFEKLYYLCKSQGRFHEEILETYSPRMREIVFKDLYFYNPSYISLNTSRNLCPGFYDQEFLTWDFICYAPPRSLSDVQVSLLGSGTKFYYSGFKIDCEKLMFEHKYKAEKWYYLIEHINNHNIIDHSKILEFHQDSYPFREIKKEYWDRLNWEMLSYNRNIDYNIKRLIYFEEYWNWDFISMNPCIMFDIDILTKFKDRINWHLLSGLESTFWSEEILEHFKDKWIWGKIDIFPDSGFEYLLLNGSVDIEEWDWGKTIIKNSYSISSNKSIPWTIEILEKYKNYLDWHQISKNISIPWSKEILDRFAELIPIGRYNLLSNNSFYERMINPILNEDTLNDLLQDNFHTYLLYPDTVHYLNEYKYKGYNKIYDLYDILEFGKYTGRRLSEIIETDLNYIFWLFKNVNFHVSLQVVDYLNNSIYKLTTPERIIKEFDKSNFMIGFFSFDFRNPDWVKKVMIEQRIRDESSDRAYDEYLENNRGSVE